MLKKVKVYPVSIPTDNTTSETYGFCIDKQKGLLAAKGKGWWGTDGRVSPNSIDAVQDLDTGEIYVHKGILLDLKEDFELLKKEQNQKKIEELKSKLTKEELDFIRNNKFSI